MKPVEMLKSVLQYMLGIFLLFLSFGLLVIEGNFLLFIFTLTGGIICLPPSRKWVEGQLNFRLPTGLRYVLVFWAFLSIGIFAKPSRESTPDSVQGLYQSRSEEASDSKDKDVMPVKTTTTVTTTTTTVEPVAAPRQAAQTAYAETEEADANEDLQTGVDEVDDEPETVVEQPAPATHKYSRRRSSSREYIRGPRGGCYYINSNGNKTYVDRSMCD
jgi:hypothetical protein